jgi:glycosyltransferase involved in cell wall biosynthesis
VGERARAASLQRAVRSVLDQRGVEAECIVIFNGSNYDATAIAWTQAQERTRCVVMDGPDKPRATLVGRSLVNSEFFCYLDDDDELLPGALERRVDIIRRRHLDCVATNGYAVEGRHTRPVFTETRALHETGYVHSLLASRNWLASCGGLFRTATVNLSYFQNLPQHREWTVIAFRIASTLKVHFEDVATFRIYSSPDSQSKKDSYIDAGVHILEDMQRYATDAEHITMIAHRKAAAYRAMCSYYRLRRNFGTAWRAYWNAVRSRGGWTYIPYGLLLLFRRVEPWPVLAKKYRWPL